MAHMAAAAADGALRRLLQKPLPENPTLLEVLSACSNHIHHNKPLPAVDPASFTEIFGELHFHEKPDAVAAAVRLVLPPVPHPAAEAPARGMTASWLDVADQAEKSKDDSSLDALLRPKPAGGVRRSASFCMKKSSTSLLLCTEGLGSESTVDSDDMVKDDGDDASTAALRGKETEEEAAAERTAAAEGPGPGGNKEPPPSFPPPIRSIGRGGRPCVCFRSFRAEGRFVLTQVVIPGKELLHASREGGRLRMQFANASAAAGVGADEEEEEVLELGDQEDHEGNSTCETCA